MTKTGPALPDVHRAIRQLQRLTELFGKRRAQLATGAGLSEQQWRVLEEIATEHFMPSMFARGRKSTPAAVSRIIRQLLDKQLVSVSVSRTDGRQRTYVLTARGRRTLEALRTQRRRAIDAIWLDLDRQALDAFIHSSHELIVRLETYAADPRLRLGSGNRPRECRSGNKANGVPRPAKPARQTFRSASA